MKNCIDCGKEINYGSTRCCSCSNKEKFKNPENHPNWKGKSLPRFCVECGKKLKTKGWGKQANIKYCNICCKKGEKSPLWKGGVTPQRTKEYHTEQYRQFVNTVLRRDNYTCQKCGTKNGEGKKIKLEVHHKKSYAENIELRFDVSNGITLCKKCHIETRQGKTRPNRIDKILVKKICVKCGKEFQKRNPLKYCDECKKRICKYCKAEFSLKNGKKHQMFCSRKCQAKWYSENWIGENHPSWKGYVEKSCLNCGNLLKRKKNEILTNYNKRKYCCLRCAYDDRKK